MAEPVKPRSQNSPLRRAQATATRARILDAAGTVFARSGYERTRIEDVAVEAGVAYPTVYKSFGSKPALLAAAVEHVMTSGEGGTIHDQTWFQEQLDAPDAESQLRLVARNARQLCERAGALLDVLRGAAASDATVASVWDALDGQRVERSRTTARRLAKKAHLRATIPATARTLWALTLPEIYVLQVHHGDLSADQYEHWLADLLVAAILDPAH